MSRYDLIGMVSVTERGGTRGLVTELEKKEREGNNYDGDDDDEGNDEGR